MPERRETAKLFELKSDKAGFEVANTQGPGLSEKPESADAI